MPTVMSKIIKKDFVNTVPTFLPFNEQVVTTITDLVSYLTESHGYMKMMMNNEAYGKTQDEVDHFYRQFDENYNAGIAILDFFKDQTHIKLEELNNITTTIQDYAAECREYFRTHPEALIPEEINIDNTMDNDSAVQSLLNVPATMDISSIDNDVSPEDNSAVQSLLGSSEIAMDISNEEIAEELEIVCTLIGMVPNNLTVAELYEVD